MQNSIFPKLNNITQTKINYYLQPNNTDLVNNNIANNTEITNSNSGHQIYIFL